MTPTGKKTPPSYPAPKPPPKPALATTPPADLIAPVNQAAKPTIGAHRNAAACPLKKHFVKVKLVYKDNQKPVLATACNILLGAAVVEGGPLAGGELGTTKCLDPGSYEVTFPDIDASEWSAG